MKILITFLIIVGSNLAFAAAPKVPKLKIEYSYALDMYCPEKVEPEVLTPEQVSLIANIPKYRTELISKLPSIQIQWDIQGTPLLMRSMELTGQPFTFTDLQAAVFLCPRFPFMGTPLAFNIISYLESSAKDISSLEHPLPIFFFVSTAFHEVLHKYINEILKSQPSAILEKISDSELYKAHIHLFALQKAVFDSLGLSHLLKQIENLEALHGPDYDRAWKAVHNDEAFYLQLLAELKK